MYKVVGITFINSNRIYYFAIGDIDCKKDSKVIVETERGLQMATVATDVLEMPEEKLVFPLKTLVRLVTKEDEEKQKGNQQLADKALDDARKMAQKLNLDMKFVDATFTFDKNQLLFNFLADDRVDFRELAKRLAGIYRTRIELRQIGVRDKAKEIGGLGPCGRFLCCSTFLNDFGSVSINMAKNQYIALNPTKINGICGRLMCCLKYEDDLYTELKKGIPAVGSHIKEKDLEGKVVSVDVFKRTYVVEKPDRTQVEKQINESN